MHKIGVFDSGVGGLSVARTIQAYFPGAEVVYMHDKEHVPYGDKKPTQLLEYVTPILQKLVAKGCRVIVIACNTVSTTIIDDLRGYVDVPLIGMEPMVERASLQSRSGVIAVCATPTTLKSKRYAHLKQTYASKIKVIEPDCSHWASMIEKDDLDRHAIFESINSACSEGADVIVLGCTHYHWIESLIIETAAGRADVLQPEKPVISRLEQVLSRLV